MEPQAGCSKRLWILTTLSDDEAAGAGTPLPAGLSAHLAQCPSCRLLAEELRLAGDGIRRLAESAPPADLLNRATGQCLAALYDGGRLSGRVPSEALEVPDSEMPEPSLRSWSRSAAKYLAAASILLVLGMMGMWSLRTTPPVGGGLEPLPMPVAGASRSAATKRSAMPTPLSAEEAATVAAADSPEGVDATSGRLSGDGSDPSAVAERRSRDISAPTADTLERLMDERPGCVPRAKFLSRPVCNPPPPK